MGILRVSVLSHVTQDEKMLQNGQKHKSITIFNLKLCTLNFQDEGFKAKNLVGKAGVGGKWLASPQEASNTLCQAHVTLQLKRPVEVATVELGKFY